VPVFVFGSLSAAAFYTCALREAAPQSWRRELIYMPVLLSLGIGMSISNAKAVLEALFNHQTEFTRTPKYGIEKKNQNWNLARYSPLKTLLPLVEFGFAAYFAYFFIVSALAGQWFSLPFLALFLVGFAYVAYSSVANWFPRERRISENSESAEAVVA